MEKLKFRYQILKDKIFLFSAIVGASLTGYIKTEEIWLKIIFLVGAFIGAIGVIINLAKINKIEKELDANS